MTRCALDEAVAACGLALRQHDVPEPDALLLLGTGFGALAGALREERRVVLGEVAEVPSAWREAELVCGRLAGPSTARAASAGTRVWLIEDEPRADPADGAAQPWERAFPCWLAAAAGAQTCLLTAAGVTLSQGARHAVGSLALVRDHLNLSGSTPLTGLAASQLGPLFPDPGRLHDVTLRGLALERASERGIAVGEAVAACIPGPSLATPAEIAFYRSTGADIAVQSLAGPLLACAHAGLALLAIVALTDRGDRPFGLADVLAQAEAAAPALEELLLSLGPDLAPARAKSRRGRREGRR